MPDSKQTKDMAQLLKEKMLALRPLYLKQVRERLIVLERFMQDVAANKLFTQEEYKELGVLTHSICGTGTTYGYPEITAKARVLDDALREKTMPGNPQLGAMLQALIAEMRKAESKE